MNVKPKTAWVIEDSNNTQVQADGTPAVLLQPRVEAKVSSGRVMRDTAKLLRLHSVG